MLKILIIEDSEDDTLLLVEAMERGGLDFEYERVEDRREMNDALKKEKWDAVISDYSLPRFSIQEALKLLRRRKLDIPFFVVSGVIGDEYIVELFKAGAHDFIRKDNLKRLVPALKRELNDAETRRKQKQAEEVLVESEKKANDILNNTRLHMWAFDGEFYSYLNKEWYNYTGQDPALPNTLERWTKITHPDDLDTSEKIWLKHWETKTEHENYFRLKGKDGEYRHFYSHAVPIFNEDGSFKHFQGYNLDITDRKKTENELKQKMKQLERFNKVAVGRELKMIELKKEINELLEKAGMEIKYSSLK